MNNIENINQKEKNENTYTKNNGEGNSGNKQDIDSVVYNITTNDEEVLDAASKEIAKNSNSNSNVNSTNTIIKAAGQLKGAFIKSQFECSSRFEYTTNDGEKEWRETRTPLTKFDIADHMAEDVDVIYGARPLTDEDEENAARNIVVDIDINYDWDSSYHPDYDYKNLYEICIDFFGHEGFPIRSSSSGNLHVYYPTSYPAPFKFIQDIEKAMNLLVDGNWFEVYPKRGALRIPLGHDSAPVDTLMLEPKTDDPEEKVEFFLSGIKQAVPIISLYNIQNKITPIFREHAVKPTSSSSKSIWMQEGKELFEDGLQPGGINRHHAQMRVSTYLKYGAGMEDEDEIVETIFNWIKKKHNGCSKEINAGNYTKVRKDIERIVYANDGSRRVHTPVMDELQEIDSSSPEYLAVEQYFEDREVSDGLLKKYKLELSDLIKFLACVVKLTEINNSDTVPIVYNVVRKLGAKYERAFKLARQVGYIRCVKKHNIFKRLAAEYKLMEALMMS